MIMAPEHWPADWSRPDRPDLADYRQGMLFGAEAAHEIARLMARDEPTSLCSWGDSELAAWSYESLAATPGVKRMWLDQLVALTGFDPEDRPFFRHAFDQYAAQAPAFLSTSRWPLAEAIAQRALAAQGIDWRGAQFRRADRAWAKIDVHAVYALHGHGCLAPILEDERLLIVSGYAEEVAARLESEAFRRELGVRRLKIVDAVQAPGMRQPKRSFWPGIVRRLERMDWTLAVLCCGGLAFPLANECYRLRRRAIDLGALDRVLAGGRHPHAHGLPKGSLDLGIEGRGI